MLRVTPADGGAEVVLGEPAFDWQAIPLAMPMDTRDMPVAWDELEHGAAVSVGNPHIIFFVPEAGKTAAEMTAGEKNATSHRYRALVEMKYLLIDAFDLDIGG